MTTRARPLPSVAPLQFTHVRHGPAVVPAPLVEYIAGNYADGYRGTPKGVILHGTRSGGANSVEQEYQGTLNFVRSGAGGLGWTATIGENKVCTHMDCGLWGWNARAASPHYLATEFAQAHLGDLITDGQIDTFVWWFKYIARNRWPNLPAYFVNHSDIDGNETGNYDGKTDVEPAGVHTVRDRILAKL